MPPVSFPRPALVFAGCVVAALALGAVLLALSPLANSDLILDSEWSGVERALVVLAHADDEVMNGGLIAYLAGRGVRVHLVTLTDGAANPQSNLQACAEDDIRDCRAREVHESARRLGVREVALAQLPDGVLSQHEDEGVRFVMKEMEDFAPDAVLTVEPSGLNGNADHMAAQRIALEALVRAPKDKKPRTLVLTTLPFPIDLFLKTRFPREVGVAPRHFLLSEELIRAKSEAAAKHASQLSTLARLSAGAGPEALFRWMRRESFYVLQGDALARYLASPARGL